jgi:hypothetical protein
MLQIVSFLKKEVARGANPGPLNFIYFLIFHHFTAEPQFLSGYFIVVCMSCCIVVCNKRYTKLARMADKSGTDVMIFFKIFSPKNWRKKISETSIICAKIWIVTLGFFKEKRQFFRQ